MTQVELGQEIRVVVYVGQSDTTVIYDASAEVEEGGTKCPGCDELIDVADAVRLYECGTCGEVNTERRCETCNKFKAKLTDLGCPECEEGNLEEGEGEVFRVKCPVCSADLETDADGSGIVDHFNSGCGG